MPEQETDTQDDLVEESTERRIFETYEVKTHLVMAVLWQGPGVKDAITENELRALDVPYERSRNWGRLDQANPWELTIKNPMGDYACPRGHFIVRKSEDEWETMSEEEFHKTYNLVPMDSVDYSPDEPDEESDTPPDGSEVNLGQVSNAPVVGAKTPGAANLGGEGSGPAPSNPDPAMDISNPEVPEDSTPSDPEQPQGESAGVPGSVD